MLVSPATRRLIETDGYRLGSFRDLAARPDAGTGIDDAPVPAAGAGAGGAGGVPREPAGRSSARRVRWWSAPFPAIEAALPSSGRILEIGCGHGLFCTYLALAEPAREVVGVDIDADKIAQARRSPRVLPAVRLSFEVATSGAVKTGPWDAIAIVDMLYLLPAADQRGAADRAAVEQLAPGGVLLVKEMSPTPRWKARWNVLQETLSVSILGITERADRRTASQEARTRHRDNHGSTSSTRRRWPAG